MLNNYPQDFEFTLPLTEEELSLEPYSSELHQLTTEDNWTTELQWINNNTTEPLSQVFQSLSPTQHLSFIPDQTLPSFLFIPDKSDCYTAPSSPHTIQLSPEPVSPSPSTPPKSPKSPPTCYNRNHDHTKSLSPIAHLSYLQDDSLEVTAVPSSSPTIQLSPPEVTASPTTQLNSLAHTLNTLPLIHESVSNTIYSASHTTQIPAPPSLSSLQSTGSNAPTRHIRRRDFTKDFCKKFQSFLTNSPRAAGQWRRFKAQLTQHCSIKKCIRMKLAFCEKYGREFSVLCDSEKFSGIGSRSMCFCSESTLPNLFEKLPEK